MSTRISERIAGAGLLCLALAACGSDTGQTGDVASSAEEGSAGGMADCAIGANMAWKRDCAVERNGDLLTVRHPDGGFRRFHVVKDGRGIETADGAERASVGIVAGDQIELAVGLDRYRLPAIIAGGAAR